MKNLLEKIADLNVLVVGDVMLDHYIWGDAHRISPEAPVPVVHVRHDTYSAGGAANVALNLVFGHAYAHLYQILKLASQTTCQAKRLHALGFGCPGGVTHVLGISRGTEAQQGIPCLSQTPNILLPS